MTAQEYLLPFLVLAQALTGASPTRTDSFTFAIQKFGGRPAAMDRFPATVEGFDAYLRACGVRSLPAAALTRPNHTVIAARLGYIYFLPQKQWWPRGAALALMTERLEEAVGERVSVRNWWRPPAYNADPTVGGAPNGDHPTATAIDLDYQTPQGRMRAERWLRELDRQVPALRLSLGLGGLTTHVGIGSPRGHREWHYAGWVPAD